MVQLKAKWLDIASMMLSALCVVHCVALPFIVVGLPFLGVFANAEWVHQVLVLMAAPLSLWAIAYSRAWRRWPVTSLISAGVVLLAAAAFIPALEPVEALISVVGALMIAAAHITNYLAQRPVHIHSTECAHGVAGD